MENTKFQAVIVNEVIKQDCLRAILYDSGVIEICWDPTIEIIEVDDLKQMKQAVFELAQGEKRPLLFTMHEFLNISADARKFAVSEDCITYSLSIAVVIDSFAKKFLFNFFMKTNKPIVPTKGFTNREDCFLWLEKWLLDQQK